MRDTDLLTLTDSQLKDLLDKWGDQLVRAQALLRKATTEWDAALGWDLTACAANHFRIVADEFVRRFTAKAGEL